VSENNALRNTVVGTVVGGLILSLIQWLTGLLTPVSNWLKETVVKLWAVILIQVAVPVWLIAILVAASATLLLRYRNVLFQRREEIKRIPTPIHSAAKQALNDKEKKILVFHAEMEIGYVMTASEVATEFKIHREEAQYYLDQLQDRGYIQKTSEADTGEDGFQLTKNGRSYLVENKLLTEMTVPDIPNLSREAQTLLKEASHDPNGIIFRLSTFGGPHIQTNKKKFGGEGDPRIRAIWEGALEELENEHLIIDKNYKKEVFEVTRKGYEIAELINP